MKKYSINPMRTGVFAAIVFFFLSVGCQTMSEEEDAISEDVTDAVSADDESVHSKDENGDEDLAFEEEIESIAEGLKDLLGGESGEGAMYSPINWRELEELLPNRLNGVSLNVTEGQTVDIGGGFSSVSGQYEDEEQEVTIVIADLASLSGIAAYAMSEWIGDDIFHSLGIPFYGYGKYSYAQSLCHFLYQSPHQSTQTWHRLRSRSGMPDQQSQ